MLGYGDIIRIPGSDAISRAARRRWLFCLLAALFLVASVAISARLLTSGGVADAPGASHDTVTPASDRAQPAASNGQPTDRSQGLSSPNGQQPVGLEEAEDWSAKKFLSAFALHFAPFDNWDEYAGWKPERVLIEVGSDDPPPQLLQRPPPAG